MVRNNFIPGWRPAGSRRPGAKGRSSPFAQAGRRRATVFFWRRAPRLAPVSRRAASTASRNRGARIASRPNPPWLRRVQQVTGQVALRFLGLIYPPQTLPISGCRASPPPLLAGSPGGCPWALVLGARRRRMRPRALPEIPAKGVSWGTQGLTGIAPGTLPRGNPSLYCGGITVSL